MKKRFNMNWSLHATWIIILLTAALLGKLYLRQMALLGTEIGQLQQRNLKAVQNMNMHLHVELQEKTFSSPSERNRKNRLFGDGARALVSKFFVNSSQFLDDPEWEGMKPSPGDSLKPWERLYYELGDSLAVLFSGQQELKDQCTQLVGTAHESFRASQLDNSLTDRTSDKRVIITSMQMNAELAFNKVLTSLLSMTEDLSLKCDAILPVIYNDDCARVGQPFHADIILLSYVSKADILRIYANNKRLQTNNGVARYIPSSGKQNFRIVYRNAATGREEYYDTGF